MSNCSSDSFVGHYDICGLPQGADTSIPIAYKPSGTLADLSAYTAKLQVRQTYGAPVLVELSTSDSSIEVDSTAPNITLHFLHTKIDDLTITEGMIYDLEIMSGSGVITRILEGSFSVTKQVTV